jgi:hypothetical protein
MKPSTRAFIFSLLIFPGAGLWVLGKKQRALVFIIPTSIILILLMVRLISIAQSAINKMITQTFSIDIVRLYLDVHSQLYNDPSIRKFLWLLLAAIILSSISSYFVGKKIEQEQA